jgi:hypothetical protein
VGASGMAWSARSGKSRFSAGGPVSYLSHYLLDFNFTVSIFMLHNPFFLDSISFLLDSKSTFIRRSRAKHFGYPPFLTTKALQNHSSRIKHYFYRAVFWSDRSGGEVDMKSYYFGSLCVHVLFHGQVSRRSLTLL